MKTLVIIRHGKATQESMPDTERYLIEKGIKRTKKFALRLKDAGVFPDKIISSTAVRTYQTAEIIADVFDYSKENIEKNPSFYFHSLQTTVHQIYSLQDSFSTVFIVGHNPIWTDLVEHFGQLDIWHLRTSGMVAIQFNTDKWQDIEQAEKKEIAVINYKNEK
jgi:phosphohistidine phosphatase